MATLAHPVPTHAASARAEPETGRPRSSGFEIIVPLAALYVVLLVIGPFIAMAYRHAPT